MALVRSAADILAEVDPHEGMDLRSIDIVRIFEVRCPACNRTVATASTHPDALAKRRDHFYAVHRGPR